MNRTEAACKVVNGEYPSDSLGFYRPDKDGLYIFDGHKFTDEEIGKYRQLVNDGYTLWLDGGECPVNPNETVSLVFDFDEAGAGISTKAKNGVWTKEGRADDIIAYRVVGEKADSPTLYAESSESKKSEKIEITDEQLKSIAEKFVGHYFKSFSGCSTEVDSECSAFEKVDHYTDKTGTDLIDDFARHRTPEQFRGAMMFLIEKYMRRCGKKDDIEDEVYKIADYANRWLEYEKKLK